MYMRVVFFLLLIAISTSPLHAQTNWERMLSGAVKAGQAMTITDEDLAKVVRQQVIAMDRQSNVCGENSNYTKRLKQLTKDMKDADGIKLNFKVYQTTDLNAFACPDGSV